MRELLIRRNVQLGDFAEAMGVSQALLSLWLTAKRFPNAAHRQAIQRYFKLPFDALFEVVGGEEGDDGGTGGSDAARAGE